MRARPSGAHRRAGALTASRVRASDAKMCRPSQTPHLTMSSTQIDLPRRDLEPKGGAGPRLRLTE
ncbi:hypothetical protein HPP92_006797 [Vanilla planifolia]|uniref:Uncharacterized protein n=1 Tax=Vanilla planifolia TaxID=51239 RepID=A0A835RF24_VANPL|nr:hypothetical protein HPP92_006797 [Vanilla planifolia]